MTMSADLTLLSKQDEAYTVWRFAIACVGELLLLTNSEEQRVMADVAGPEDWNGNAITIFAGIDGVDRRSSEAFKPRLRIGDMSALRVWDGQIDARALDVRRAWDTLWPELSLEEPKSVAERLAGHFGFKTRPPKEGAVERSWGEIWARIFAASVDALECIESELPWVLQTSYRDGAGHYVHFDPCGILFQGFYLNQGGYISCNRDDGHIVTDKDNLNRFDIRRAIEGGASRNEIQEYLQSAIQPMIDRIESRGFE